MSNPPRVPNARIALSYVLLLGAMEHYSEKDKSITVKAADQCRTASYYLMGLEMMP